MTKSMDDLRKQYLKDIGIAHDKLVAHELLKLFENTHRDQLAKKKARKKSAKTA